jgi:hypothetical protein
MNTTVAVLVAGTLVGGACLPARAMAVEQQTAPIGSEKVAVASSLSACAPPLQLTALRRVTVLFVILALGPLVGLAQSAEDTIAPGTVITMQNWQRHKQFMPDGMIALFEGKYFWKMPPDVEMDVQAPVLYPLPKPYIDVLAKYGNQARLVKLPDGRFKLENYVAGVPFPHPSGPYKGTEIAADVTYRPQGHLLAGFLDSNAPPVSFFLVDRFGNTRTTLVDYDYRQLAYNWMPGIPRTEPAAAGAWYTEWLMVEQPEESKYSGALTVFHQDNLRIEDYYVFIPALRRSEGPVVTARCVPLFGSDMTHDDQRYGWNGGVGMFEGTFLRDQKVLALTAMNDDAGEFPQNYDMPLGWAKPSWGKWQLMDAWVTDVHRIPEFAAGYCYGKRVMYTSKYYYAIVSEDLYDANNKLWKIVQTSWGPHVDCLHPEWGPMGYTAAGTVLEQYWDIQKDHVSHVINAYKGKGGAGDCYAPQYDNIAKYSTSGGLMQIMR